MYLFYFDESGNARMNAKSVAAYPWFALGADAGKQRAPENWELWIRLMIGGRFGASYGGSAEPLAHL